MKLGCWMIDHLSNDLPRLGKLTLKEKKPTRERRISFEDRRKGVKAERWPDGPPLHPDLPLLLVVVDPLLGSKVEERKR